MSILQLLRPDVENVMAGVKQQHQLVSNLSNTLKSYVPRVQSAWLGGDADEFAADVQRKVVPAMAELLAAIAGINLHLTKATTIVDEADAKAKSLAETLQEQF